VTKSSLLALPANVAVSGLMLAGGSEPVGLKPEANDAWQRWEPTGSHAVGL